ncbi:MULTISPECIES: hypothetical protein [unclassified Methylobacterium]|jgi:hypothetical protein|uniref:hypothetical protein n=1 Tax=unclassified Methylobacterium TaxID=2615210 RepID=UPI0013537F31|nr:hypothetical protein [Methylobacterium sp. 2A]MWV23508.1 hypothetical protein [Methylobacterium sp. 2A]
MTNTVPAGAHDPARPPAPHEGLEALLEILPHRYKPGLRALLSGPGPDRPGWGRIDVQEEWLASVLALIGMGRSWSQPSQGEPIPIRIGYDYDAQRGPHLVVSASAWPTAAQAAADAELRQSLERQGRWRPSRAPDTLRQLYALVPEAGGPCWGTLAPGLLELHERRIISLAERPVDFEDADAVHEALREAAKFAHFAGLDAVLIVTGDRRIGCRTFSDPRVVEAVCDLGTPLLTLAGPAPTLVDALAWRSSPVPGAVLAAIEATLRGELARADRARLDRIAETFAGPPTAPGDAAWPDAPF